MRSVIFREEKKIIEGEKKSQRQHQRARSLSTTHNQQLR